MGATMVDRNIAFLGKRNKIKHILTSSRVDYIRICKITMTPTRTDRCRVHQKEDCVEMYVKLEDAVNELADAVAGRQL